MSSPAQKPLNIKQGIGSTLAAFTSASGALSGSVRPGCAFWRYHGDLGEALCFSRLTHDIYLYRGVAPAISAGFNAPIAGVVFCSRGYFGTFRFAPLHQSLSLPFRLVPKSLLVSPKRYLQYWH